MSMELAKCYIERMRVDEPFRQAVNALSEDEEKSWGFVKERATTSPWSSFVRPRKKSTKNMA